MKDWNLEPDGFNKGSKLTIRTWTGAEIDPFDPDPLAINIEDIAHALARTCRYGGHVEGFLSVASHSLMVVECLARNLGSPEARLRGLLHDASEAYIGDLPRPLKNNPLARPFLVAEAALEDVIADVFRLSRPLVTPAVKDADTYVLLHRELGGDHPMRTLAWGDYEEDEADFLDAFWTLWEALR